MNRLKTKEKNISQNQRKARTRTLIQLGGILELLNLTDEFSISLGEDLQLEQDSQDKAATLLGFLEDAKIAFLENQDPALKKEKWRQYGITKLKMETFKKNI